MLSIEIIGSSDECLLVIFINWKDVKAQGYSMTNSYNWLSTKTIKSSFF